MRLLRIPLLILSILVLSTTTLGLRYVTARPAASGDYTCVQYPMVDALNNPYFIALDSSTGDTYRKRTKPFVRTVPYITNQRSSTSPDGKWMIYTRNEPTSRRDGMTTLWIIPLRFGLPIAREAVVFTASGSSGNSRWSSDSRTLVTDIVIEGQAPYFLRVAVSRLDDNGMWTTRILNSQQYIQEGSTPAPLHNSSWDGKVLITSSYVDTGILHKRWDTATLRALDSVESPDYSFASLSPNRNVIATVWRHSNADGQGSFAFVDFDTQEVQTTTLIDFTVVRALVWDKQSRWVALVVDGEKKREDVLHVFGVDGTIRLNVERHELNSSEEETTRRLLEWTLGENRLIYDTGGMYDRRPIIYDPVADEMQSVGETLSFYDWFLLDDADQSHFYVESNKSTDLEVLRDYAKVSVDTGESVPLLTNVRSIDRIVNRRFVAGLTDFVEKIGTRPSYRTVAVSDVITGTSTRFTHYNGVPFRSITSWINDQNSRYYFVVASLESGSAGDNGSALYRIDPVAQTVSQLTPPSQNTQLFNYLYRNLSAVIITENERQRAILFDNAGVVLGNFDLGVEFDLGDLRRTLILPDPTDVGIPYMAVIRYKDDFSSESMPYIIHSDGQKYPVVPPGANYSVLTMQWLPEDDLLVTQFVKRSVGGVLPYAHTVVTDRYGAVKYSTVLDWPIGISSEGQWSACR